MWKKWNYCANCLFFLLSDKIFSSSLHCGNLWAPSSKLENIICSSYFKKQAWPNFTLKYFFPDQTIDRYFKTPLFLTPWVLGDRFMSRKKRCFGFNKSTIASSGLWFTIAISFRQHLVSLFVQAHLRTPCLTAFHVVLFYDAIFENKTGKKLL